MRLSLLSCLAAISAIPLVAEPLVFSLNPEAWHCKVNVQISQRQKGLQVDVETSTFNFGWISATLPEPAADSYAPYDGIYGRVRAPRNTSGTLRSLVILPRGDVRQYFGTEVLSLPDCDGEWQEFYVPFSIMKAMRNATGGITSASLAKGDVLELQLTGIGHDAISVEFDDLKLMSSKDDPELLKRLQRDLIARRLRPEDTLDAVRHPHPRLLLTPDRLARMRAKATAGGRAQKVYELVIKQADGFLKSVNAEQPFANLLDFSPSKQLTAHQQQGSFEGRMVPMVRPIETLAIAGWLTGDERYSRHAAKTLVNMARTLTVHHPQIELGFYYTRTFYVRALALGYDWLWHYLTPAERRQVKTTLLGFVLDIYDKSSIHNWGRLPLQRVWNWDPGLVSCAGLGVLAMEGETKTPEEAMIFTFRRHLRDYLTLGVDVDGCGHEGPSYITYGIGSGSEFMECLREQGRDDLFTGTNLHLIAPWLVAETLPSRATHNNLSDCPLGQVPSSPIYAYAMGRYAQLAKEDPVRPGERLPAPEDITRGMEFIKHFSEIPGKRQLSYGALAQLMSWAWESGSRADDIDSYAPHMALAYLMYFEDVKPCEDPADFLPQGLHFRGRGLVVSRDGGYDKDGHHLAVEAGPHAAGHDQADKGTFTYRAYKGEFFIDSGYGNDGNPLGSGSAYAHNVVLCDGKGQPCKWHNNSDGAITGFHTSPQLDWIRVDALPAWNSLTNIATYQRQDTGMNMAVAERQFAFVRAEGTRPAYLVVYDNIAKRDSQEHDFTWQWHHPQYLNVDASKIPWLGKQDNTGYEVLTTELDPDNPNKQWGRNSAIFTFKVPATGDYRLIGLTLAGGIDTGKSDSFIVEVGSVRINSWDSHPGRQPSWSEVRERGEAIGQMFSLKKDELFEVKVFAREPQAGLLKLALIPYKTNIFVSSEETAPGAVVLSLDDAKPGDIPFVKKIYQPMMMTEAQVAVYPVGHDAGKVAQRGYQTSKEGSHGLLQYTVRARNPHFVMVIVPRRDSDGTLPVKVEPLPEGQPGAVVVWPDGCRDRLEFPLAQAEQGSRTLNFSRQGQGVAWQWQAADAAKR